MTQLDSNDNCVSCGQPVDRHFQPPYMEIMKNKDPLESAKLLMELIIFQNKKRSMYGESACHDYKRDNLKYLERLHQDKENHGS